MWTEAKMVFKRGIKGVLLLILAIFLVFSFSACGETGEVKGEITVLPDETSEKSLTFTVDFQSNGGTSVSSVVTNAGEKISQPSTPKKEGYTFEGWYTTATYSRKWDFSKDTVSANTTLYAQWILTNAVQVFDAAFSFSNGTCYYSVSASTDVLDITSKLVLQEENARYAFYSDANCSILVGEEDVAVLPLSAGRNVFYLKIMDSSKNTKSVVPFIVTRNSLFKVSFYDNNGYWMQDFEVEEGRVVSNAVDYVLTGYTVVWKTSTGKEWEFGQQGDKVMSDVSLYAELTPVDCVVVFDANGGEISLPQVSVLFGSTPTFPVPSKKYASFLGWYTAQGDKVSGSSGVSETQWNFTESVRLTAAWEISTVSVTITTELDGESEFEKQSVINCGDGIDLSVTSRYSSIKKTGAEYVLYVFGGWYEGNARLSDERTYRVPEVTTNSVFKQIWYSFTVGTADDVDQTISFSVAGSDDIVKYGNATSGDVITVDVNCSCGNHTFVGWEDTDSTSSTRMIKADGTIRKDTKWLTLSVIVKCYLDGELTSEEAIVNSITGAGNARYQSVCNVSAIPKEEYTFGGWYKDGVLQQPDFEYEFFMDEQENAELETRWFTTSNYLTITPNDALAGSVGLEIDPEKNFVGGCVTLVPNVESGYMLEGLYIGNEKEFDVTKDNLVVGIPSVQTDYTAVFVANNVKIDSNVKNAGRVIYAINGKETTGTTYGGDISMVGMLNGDKLAVEATVYNGFVWLGWYKNGAFLTKETQLLVGAIQASEAEEGLTLEACWKPIRYNVNVTAGVYSRTAPTYITAGRYYTYENGLFAQAPTGAVVPETAYYVFSDYNEMGGKQKVTASECLEYPGEKITLHAEINYEYRFEGWYDQNGSLLTFERDYTFNVKDLKDRYQAWYSYIPSVGAYRYEVETAIYPNGGANVETPQRAGSVNYYAYKTKTESGSVREICRMEVKTQRGEITKNSNQESVCRGYNYKGFYENTQGLDLADISWTMVMISAVPVPSVDGFDKDLFGYAYEITVERGEKRAFYAVWTRTESSEYYVTADIFNDNVLAGNIYYMGSDEKLILVAVPNNGYVFAGWEVVVPQTGATSTVGTSVYETNEKMTGRVITAKWKQMNDGVNRYVVRVSGSSVAAEGSYYAYAEKDGNSDFITLSETTNDGYIFMGWFVEDILFSQDEVLSFVRYADAESETLKWMDGSVVKDIGYDLTDKKFVLPNGYKVSSVTFEPRWKKTDAIVTVESVGDVKIIGYLADDNGVPRYKYRLSTYTDMPYNDNYASGWYKGYIFKGWYDEDGNKLSESLILEVFEDNLLPYYKAVWEKIDVTVDITYNNQDAGCVATYSFVRDGENMYLILNAVPANGYAFSGWQRRTDEGSTKDSEDCYYIQRIGGSTKLYEYIVFFTEIEAEKPTAITSSGTPLAGYAPKMIGYGTYYVVTAQKIKGYTFLGWRRSIDTTISDTNFSCRYGADSTFSMVAVYEEITNFTVRARVDRFKDNIAYYGYIKEGERIYDIAVTLEQGYTYTVNSIGVLGLRRYYADEKNPEIVHLKANEVQNSTVYVEFELICDKEKSHINVVSETDNVSLSRSGYYVLRSDGYIEERWILKATFGQDDYSFVGWYNGGVLLGVRDRYDIPSARNNAVYNVVFGKYELELINDDESAGKISADGYDVTVTFIANTERFNVNPGTDEWRQLVGSGTVSTQQLNVGDTLVYPLLFVNVDAGGFMFAGWYDNAECEGSSFDFTSKIKKDITLYARWVSITDYSAGKENILTSDGKEYFIKTSYDGERKYFTALYDGEYELTVKNQNSGQITKVVFGEAKEEGGMNDILLQFTVSGNTEIKKSLSVKVGVTYCIEVYETNTASDYTAGKNAMIKLFGENPVSTAKRDNVMPYGGSIDIIAQPQSYSRYSEQKTESIFAGWYYYNDASDEWILFTDKEETIGQGGKRFTVYPLTTTLSYENYERYACADGKIKLRAKWEKYEITVIPSDREGGETQLLMTIDEVTDSITYKSHGWQLTALPRSGFTFAGWYLYDEEENRFEETPVSTESFYTHTLYDEDKKIIIKCEWVYTTGSGIRTITYQMNTGDAINSPFNVSNFTELSEDPILLYNPHKYYYDEDTEEIVGYYVFEGWYTEYSNNSYSNKITQIDPNVYKTDITVYAKWGKAVNGVDVLTDVDGSKYFYMGLYPQTLVEGDETADIVLDNRSDYRESFRNIYNYYSMSNRNKRYVRTANGKYFRCDPVRWNILSDKNGRIYAEASVVLDYGTYNSTTSRSADGRYCANNWEFSGLRSLLNGKFASNCFTFVETNRLENDVQTVGNGSDSANKSFADGNKFVWAKQNDTRDKVFLASYVEKTNVLFGYKSKAEEADDARKANYSDYALEKAGQNNGYWLRTWAETEAKVYSVNESGVISSLTVTQECGIRPIISIDLGY